MAAILERKAKNWVQRGIITPEQAARILELEKAGKPWLGGWVAMLGIMVVGLGVIAIIAANWHLTPDWLKLGGNGLLLASSAWLTWRFHGQGLAWPFELMLLFSLLYVLASIGLIGQIFHSGQPFYMATLLWCIMGAGYFFIAAKMPVPFIWLAGLFTSLIAYLLDNHREEWVAGLLPHLPLALGLITLLCALAAGSRAPQARAAAMWLLGALFAVDLAAEFGGFRHFTITFPKWLLAGGGLALSLLWLCRFFSTAQKAALTLGVLWLLLLSFMPERLEMSVSDYRHELIHPVATFTLLAWLSFYAVASGHSRLFLLWLVLAGARVCAVFIMAAYGLWETGCALLFSGAVLVAIPFVWKKFLLDRLFKSARVNHAL